MTPNEIEILIHCHTTPSQHPRSDFPGVRKAIKMLLAEKLIEQDAEGSFFTTGRGQAMIKLLCRLEFPQSAWIDQAGELIGL